jgi:Dolichyl-phosphate-mannose-protein mannosyltransferase
MLPWKLYMKRLRIGPHELVACAVIACAVILRLVLTANHWPSTQSDEGTMGLEAMHIAFRGEHPVFFYGQNYMGVVEAYLGALLFRLFGVSVFSLRLGMILLFALFLISIYCLTSLLYTKKLALITLLLLCFGSEVAIRSELLAVGGIVETLLFSTLAMLLACWLALTADTERRRQQGWRRFAAFGGWGLVVGLGIWSDVLIAPFVLTGGIIILLFCWREWRSWAIPCISAGLLLGACLLIKYNLTAPPDQNSLAVTLSIQGGSDPGAGIVVGSSGPLKHLVSTFLYALPVATGLYPMCKLDVLPIFGQFGPTTWSCSIAQGGWSLGYMALLLISMAMAIVPLSKLLIAYRSRQEAWSEEQRQLAVLYVARLALILCGLLTITLFLRSTLGAAKPTSSRYLIGLSIVLPSVLWPLWNSIEQRAPRKGLNILWMVVRYALLLFVTAMVLVSTVAILPELSAARARAAADQQLLHDLEQRGITRFYSEYWTCDRLTFLSQEQTICSDINTSFQTAQVNRIPAYTAIVASDARTAYVLPAGAFTKAAARHPVFSKHYRRFTLDGYVVYEPSS